MTRALVAFALLVACSGARPPVAAVRPASPAVRPASPAVVTVEPAEGPLHVVDDAHFFAGGLRGELRDGAVTFAEDGTAEPIVAATKTDGPWVFLVTRGVVAVSESFLGPLRVVGRVPAWGGMPPSRGRAVLVKDGHLWTSDGHSVAAVDVLGRPVTTAGFADGLFGAAVLADGALAVTRDGGARWEAVDLAGDVALGVEGDDALRVRLLHRWVTVRRDGGIEDCTPPPDRDRPRPSLAVMRSAVESRGAARDRLLLAGSAWVRRAGDMFTMSDGRGEPRVWTPPEADCDLTRWGAGAAIGCRGAWYRLDPDGRVTVLVSPDGALELRPPDEGVVWSDDGRHAALLADCPRAQSPEDPSATETEPAPDEGDDPGNEAPESDDPEDPRARVEALCLLEDGARRWRRLELPDRDVAGVRWQLVGLHGAQALLRNALDETEHVTFDTGGGAKTPVRFEDPSVHVRSLRWATDGALYGLAERCGDGCVSAVLVGAPERPLAVRTAPGTVTQVAFADARRGVAVDPRGAALWRTWDGARSWERVPVEGAALHGERLTVACDDAGCEVGEHIRIQGWGPLGRPEGRLLAVEGAAPEAPRFPAEVEGESPRVREAECVVAGAPRRSPWAVRGAESGARDIWREGVWSMARGQRGGAATLRWWGASGRGAGMIPPLDDAHEDPSIDYVFLGGSRASLVLARTSPPRLLWLDAGGARPVEGAPLVGAAASAVPLGRGSWFVTPTDDGGAVVQVFVEDYSRKIDVVAELGPDGGARTRRSFMAPTPTTVAVARHQGRWGRVSVSGAGTRFDPLAGGAPTALPPWRGAMSPCASRAAPDAVTLHVPAAGVRASLSWNGLPSPRSGTCQCA